MAYTLGLHRDQRPMSGTEVEREEHRRIWWTLFTLDLEIGMRGGSPTIVDERYIKITTALPHEQVSTIGDRCRLDNTLTICRSSFRDYTRRPVGYPHLCL